MQGSKNTSARGEQFQANAQGRTTGGEAELALKPDPLQGVSAPINMTRSQNVVIGGRPSAGGAAGAGDGGATS